MKKILTILITSYFLLATSTVWAEYTNLKLKLSYNKIVYAFETKYSLDKQYEIYKKLNDRIEKVLNTSKLSTTNYNLINYLYKLNSEQLNKVKVKRFDFIWQKEDELNKRLKNQQFKESLIRSDLKNNLNNVSIPTYISELIVANKELYTLNENFEFVDWNDIKRLTFESYYKLDSSNYSYFKDKSWIVVKKSSEDNFWFVETYKTEVKIPYSKSKGNFNWFISNEIPFFEDKDKYYTYNFSTLNYLEDTYWVYKSDLDRTWINSNNLIIYLDDKDKFNFISNYSKVKLINKDLLDSVINKWYFLKELKDDKKYLVEDTDAIFSNLKTITDNLTKWLTKEEKLKAIYAWILSNIKYTEKFKLNDYEIYSWIKAFEDRETTCEWYTKLMAYMLMYAWIYDLEVIRWYVIDAKDFPDIGHAWVRIEDKYYDPTFDDPIWAISTRTFDEYYYYKLPKDLFYVNRYNQADLPSTLKTTSLESRQKLVLSNIYTYASSHPNSNYNLLDSANLRIKYSFWNRNLTISDFKKVLDFQILWDDYTINVDWNKKYIKNLNYIVVTDENIEYTMQNQFNYDLDWKYLFNRKLSDWTNDYIIWYNISYY